MKIIEYAPGSTERMYCPSTNEVIFSPNLDEINDNAIAFIGYWHHEFLDEPHVKDETLEAAWSEYFSKHLKDKFPYKYEWDDIRKFFMEYNNSGWIVYECDFHGMACGPMSYTVIYVVKADTVIEEEPDYKDPLEGMSEKEIEDEIIRRQIKGLLG